jgi:large subunit ribosomal protein L19
MDKIKSIEEAYLKKDIPSFNVGDTVRVYIKIVEEGKARVQAFEGVVIGRKGSGIQATFTVRKISFGEGVERVFQLHAPTIEKVELVKKGSVRRAKLYYLRKKIGKEAKVAEQAREEAV